MATMFPSDVSAFTTAGEEAVYNFFRRAARPDSDYLVWYSPDIKDREPDFIIFSPDCGLVVIEVKDWIARQVLEADPKSAVLQIGGKIERRKQPLAQAREYVHALMNLLGEHFVSDDGLKIRPPCPIIWGAALPHITRADFNQAGLAQVMDMQKIMFWDELNEHSPLLHDASGQKLRQWLAEHFPPMFSFSMSAAQLARLRGIIFPVARVAIPWRSGETSAQAARILALDQDQENLARMFGPGKTLISGPSGSGKTLILTHQAWHLPRMDKNIKKVLITCFNLSLVGYIRRLLARLGANLGPEGIEVIPFYELCERILGENLAHAKETGEYYDLVVQETLEQLDGENPLEHNWDAILVDEGQDFSDQMAQVILKLVPNHGALTVVMDENQSLYQENPGWENLPNLRKRKLLWQYRNTREIGELAAKIAGLANIQFKGAAGAKPQKIISATGQEQIAAVVDAIVKLVRSGYPMSQIAVLYVKSKIPGVDNLPLALIRALESRGVLARWAARDAESKKHYDITTDSVTISTIHSAKGMDFGHVFITGLDLLDAGNVQDRKLAYVGITRARENLSLCACDAKKLAALLEQPAS